ncbi:hypothetical protein H5410_063108 [Solanum commersonii]|uniref:Uncharacterized protein n=1 Tax=Solanum commersonii TaxID=4109 RepID=A0A9J5WEP6_SOLCO|nr:hypothetical protein H5410_063108 [Solanum commersonii]
MGYLPPPINNMYQVTQSTKARTHGKNHLIICLPCDDLGPIPTPSRSFTHGQAKRLHVVELLFMKWKVFHDPLEDSILGYTLLKWKEDHEMELGTDLGSLGQ